MDFVISVPSSRRECLVQIEFQNRNQLTTMTDVSTGLWSGIFVTNKKIKVNTEKTRHCQTITRWQRKVQSSEGLEEKYQSGQREKLTSLRFK
jgi:hypothetical protein